VTEEPQQQPGTDLEVVGESPASVTMSDPMGGHEYPEKYDRRCNTCRSPHRYEIEDAVAKGWPYKQVAEEVCAGGDGTRPVSAGSIRHHCDVGHMSPSKTEMRRIAEDRANRRARSTEEGVKSFVDGMATAELIVQRTWNGMAEGTLVPTIADGLRAAKFLWEIGATDAPIDLGAYIEAYQVFHDEAKKTMSGEQWEHFTQRLERNETLRYLEERIVEGQREQREAEDAAAARSPGP
jgi:hypothetical protein